MRPARAAQLLTVVVGFALMSGAVTASAFTSESFQGFTWYSEGGFMKEASSGAVITAYANGARANRAYRLVSSVWRDNGDYCEEGRQDVNPNLRYSSARGFIPSTGGVVSRPPGQYVLCFVSELTSPTDFPLITLPVFLTIV